LRIARWGDLWFCVAVLGIDVSLRPRTAVWWVGMALAAAAIPAWIAARRQLGSAFSMAARAERLVTRGIYAKIRHPIYLFGLIARFGALLALQIWPLLAGWLALTPIGSSACGARSACWRSGSERTTGAIAARPGSEVQT
jgi:protein-S-isoprenylcysteine O-methyltransferase Ste14